MMLALFRGCQNTKHGYDVKSFLENATAKSAIFDYAIKWAILAYGKHLGFTPKSKENHEFPAPEHLTQENLAKNHKKIKAIFEEREQFCMLKHKNPVWNFIQFIGN
jgi:hypothetical protein